MTSDTQSSAPGSANWPAGFLLLTPQVRSTSPAVPTEVFSLIKGPWSTLKTAQTAAGFYLSHR